MIPVPGHIIDAAETVLDSVPSYVWDGERLPVPIEDIVDTCYGCTCARSTTWPGRPAPPS